MRLVAAGLTFHSAPLALRERAVVRDGEAPGLLRYLVGHQGVTGAAVLSTCNRTEFYVSCTDELADQVTAKLGRYLDPGNDALATHLVTYRDADAVEHICRVAAGLESMVVGEAQVLGQVRAAHRLAADARTLDAALDTVLRGAIQAGKRVRTETRLGRGSGSLCEVALEAARSVVGDLASAGVLLVGAGKMSRLALRRLRGGERVYITSRSDSARRVGAELGAIAIDRDAIPDVIDDISVIISSTSSPGPVLTARDVAMWQARRHGRRLCIADLAVPRDVEPAAASIAGVSLFDVDELGRRVACGIDLRREAIPGAEAIVAADATDILARLHVRERVAPTIEALVARAEAIRSEETHRSLSHMESLDDGERERVEQLTRAVVRKLLHAPIEHLRRAGDDRVASAQVRELFSLGDAETDQDVTVVTGVAGDPARV